MDHVRSQISEESQHRPKPPAAGATSAGLGGSRGAGGARLFGISAREESEWRATERDTNGPMLERTDPKVVDFL